METARVALDDIRAEGIAARDTRRRRARGGRAGACGAAQGALAYLPSGLCPACAVLRQRDRVRAIWAQRARESRGGPA
eukprot:15452978-Alexandrium_andersonii.AAC.1